MFLLCLRCAAIVRAVAIIWANESLFVWYDARYRRILSKQFHSFLSVIFVVNF